MNIGVDLDDVVIEYVKPLLEYYNHVHFDRVRPENIVSFEFDKYLPKIDSPEEKKALMEGFMHHEVFQQLPPVPGAIASLDALVRSGHTLHFITSRASKAIDTTYKWLDAHGLPIDRVYFNKEKGWLAHKLKLGAHIDDGMHNLDGIAQDSRLTKTIIYDRPWNRSVPYVAAHERVRDWTQAFNVLDRIARTSR